MYINDHYYFMNSKQLFFLILFFSIFLLSCQKELDETSIIIDKPTGNLLVKVSGEIGDSSIQTDYTYDAMERISSLKKTLTKGRNKTISLLSYKRDTNGRITVSSEVITYNSSASDTLYTYIHYPDAFTNKFSYTTSNFGIMGTSVRDSTVFTYNAVGKVISSVTYIINILDSKTVINGKLEYRYDGYENLVEQKSFLFTRNSFTPNLIYKFIYDNSMSPLPLGNEFIFVKADGYGSKNNIRSVELTDLSNPLNNYIITKDYNINKANKPERAFEKFGSDNSYTYSYFYN